MSISLGVAVLATLAALVFTGLLVHRCTRVPRLDMAALLCASCALFIALAAQAIGYYHGFGDTTFRALHLFAQLLTPMALVWALAELTGKSLGARFAARLALGGLTVVAAVVLASDPLSSYHFTNAWPAASAYYQLIPNAILELITIVATFSAVLAAVVAGIRARRYPDWRDLFGAVIVVAIAILVTDVLRAGLPMKSAYPMICLLAAALTWLAARRASRARLHVLRLGGPVWDEDTGEFVRYNEDTGEFAPYRDDTGYGMGRADTGGSGPGAEAGYTGWYADGAAGHDGSDADFRGWFRDDRGDAGGFPPVGDDAGSFHTDGSGTGYDDGYEGTDTGFGLSPRENGANGHGAPFETGDILPVAGYDPLPGGAMPEPAASPAPGGPGAPDREDTSRLYGQIAIYTLLDGRAEEFDRLAHHIVEQVKAREHGTLVYVMHGVPSAPMQRILYEVYRDGTAFDEHMRQPYIQQFEEERKPYVLATNVIELGVRHAKFSSPAVLPRQARDEELRSWGSAR